MRLTADDLKVWASVLNWLCCSPETLVIDRLEFRYWLSGVTLGEELVVNAPRLPLAAASMAVC